MRSRTVRTFGELRNLIGESHPNAKLKDCEVDLVLELLDGGMTIRAVAVKFDIPVDTVKSISCGRRRCGRPGRVEVQ